MTSRCLAGAEPRRSPVPVVFGPAASQLFGLYHAPHPAIARSTGVVLCNPLGDEAMGTHRTYRHLAERLAATGIHALRFDYHGTGDSSGHVDEPARVEAWLDSIGAAISELEALVGTHAVDLFGVRFGATLAALAAGRRSDVRSLVLWAPCVSGRAYVRELRALRMIKEPARQGAPRAIGDEDEEIAGYRFERATVFEMSSIDLLTQRERAAERALILPREGLEGGEKRLAGNLAERGVATVVYDAPGYARMMRDPQDTIVPFATLDAIVDWLREPAAPEHVARGAEVRSTVLTAWGQATRRQVREEPFYFGDGGHLFGILTEPDTASARRGGPALVFLNVGANHRVGPNRMYVSLARDLAALGYLGFRFDVAGLGDSASPDGVLENTLFSKGSVRDVEAAVTFLTLVRDVQRVVVVGLCSGAYLGFHAASTDPRVAGQILINPLTFEWKEGDSLEPSTRRDYKSTRYYLRALLNPKVWAQALRGGVDVRGVAGVLRERFVERACAALEEVTARWRGRPVPRTEVARTFGAMSDRGVESFLVFSSTDGGLDMIEKHLGHGAGKMRGRSNVRLAIIEGADHTFTLARSRHELYNLISRFLGEAFPDGSRPRD